MLKAALIGLGRMGRGHLNVYETMKKDGIPVQLVAVCDIEKSKFTATQHAEFNLESVASTAETSDLSTYHCYTDYHELLEKEDIDFVDIVAPTYLHHEITIAALRSGKHVLCEKPMALSVQQCQEMIDTANRCNKQLMIGQVLHFWNEYVILKEYVDKALFGKVEAAYFYRGGVQDHKKNGSYQDWIIKRELGGGGLFDQHIHDTDMIRWLFGTPEKVSTIAKTIHAGSAHDIVSTNYLYADKKVVNAQDDTDMKGTYGFRYGYRVHFERGMLLFEEGKLTVYPQDQKEYVMEKKIENPYYNEIKYFAECITSHIAVTQCLPSDAMETVRIALAEMQSADLDGDKITL